MLRRVAYALHYGVLFHLQTHGHQTCIIWCLSCPNLKFLEPRMFVPEHVKCFHWWMMRLRDTRTKALLATLLLSRNGVVLDPFRPCVGKCATTWTRWCLWLPSCNQPTRPGSPSKGALSLDHIGFELMMSSTKERCFCCFEQLYPFVSCYPRYRLGNIVVIKYINKWEEHRRTIWRMIMFIYIYFLSSSFCLLTI